MRDGLRMTRVGPSLVLALVLWTGCSQERSAAPQGGSAAPGRQAAAGSTGDLNEEQQSAYLRGASAQVAERSKPSVSGKETMVHMTNEMKFLPAEVTVTVGQSILWMNTSSMVHTVTADPSLAKDPSHVQLPAGARPFNSGDIAPGATFRHTFDVPGTYVYFCIPHEPLGMVGRIAVQEKQ